MKKIEASMEEVAKYYLEHSVAETKEEFGINSGSTIVTYFFKYYGKTKKDYLGMKNKKAISKYYLSHTSKDTSDKFGVSDSAIRRSFLSVYGVSKREYLDSYRNTNEKLQRVDTNSNYRERPIVKELPVNSNHKSWITRIKESFRARKMKSTITD